MESRRSALKKVVFGSFASAFTLTASAQATTPASGTPPARESDGGIWQLLLRPLQAGEAVGFDWTIDSISPVVNGAVLMTLTNSSGVAARIRVCRNDGSPRGVAHTAEFDFVLLNGGNGHLETEEGLARVLRRIASIVSGNETKLNPYLLASVRTHDEHHEISRALSALT